MATAVGAGGHVQYPQERRELDKFGELVSRLEQLAQAQQAARAVVLSDDPDYAVAFEQIFAPWHF
jgi:hypothetical protein